MHSFQFKNQNELLIALNSEMIPMAVQEMPVKYRRNNKGVINVLTDQSFKRAQINELKKAGLTCLGKQDAKLFQSVNHWAEIIQPIALASEVDCSATVLFLIADAKNLYSLAGELLRLGCDRQSFCFLSNSQAMLRAIQPPYYSVMKALDKINGLGAYLASPVGQDELWTELGYEHALTQHIKIPEQSLGLISANGDWQYLPNGKWISIYDAMQVELPGELHKQEAIDFSRHFIVKLKLVFAARTTSPTLWVIKKDAINMTENLVRHLPEKDINQLLFTVCGDVDHPIVILKSRPSQGHAPVLEITGESCSNWMDIENLFLPYDAIIEPPLRREKIKELLANDPDSLTILSPANSDQDAAMVGVEVDRISHSAFSPLDEWVDYIVHSEHKNLQPWIRAVNFEFDRFESTGLEWTDKKPQAKQERTKARANRSETPVDPLGQQNTRDSQRQAGLKPELASPEFDWDAQINGSQETSADESALAEIERRFLDADSPADDPDRLNMWHQMALYNYRLGKHRDAALCWVRAAWNNEARSAELLQQWSDCELASVKQPGKDNRVFIDEMMKVDAPSIHQLRAVATMVICNPEIYTDSINEIKLWFDTYDTVLDLRTFWLVRTTLSRLMGNDHLQLAHARDRILLRLCNGLSLDQDVPSFLRYCGSETADTDSTTVNRLQEQLEVLLGYYESTQRNMSPLEAPAILTSAYIRLIFAWGFARLSHHDRANELLAQASSQLPKDDPVHTFLKENYTLRVQHALQGLPMETPISAELSRQLIPLEAFLRYKVDRLRQVSCILEVQERLDPVAGFQLGGEDPRGSEFAELRGMEDTEQLRIRISYITEQAISTATDLEHKVRLLDGVMDFFPLLGESVAIPNLRLIINHLDEIPALQRCVLLEEALMMSGYFGRGDMVRELVARLEASLVELSGSDLLQMAKTLSVCLSSLRRVGLTQEAVHILETVFESIAGDDVSAVIARLQVVTGLAELDQTARFQEVFAMGERALAMNMRDLILNDRLEVIKAMASASSHLPLADAIAQLQSLARQLPQITDSFNTNSHFCLSVLQFMESLVFGFAGDKLSLGELGRKWLAEDEYLIRRRIQIDVQHMQNA